MTDATPARPTRRRSIVVWSIVGACVLAVVGAVAWLGLRAVQAQQELQALQPLASELAAAAAARDVAGIEAIAGEVAIHAGRAAELTGDPIWRAAEIVPFAGPNLTAVRVVSEQLDSISRTGVEPLTEALRRVEGAKLLTDGRVDLAMLEDLRAPLAEASSSFADAVAALDAIDTDAVIGAVREGVTTLSEAVHTGDAVTHTALDAVTLLPPLLGADGPRTILLMLQNNAELRTGGGITGSFAQFDAVDGALEITRQASSADFARESTPILPLPESDLALYGDDPGVFIQNLSMTTDFDLSARLASAWWSREYGVTPDTVISIDPLVVSALLEKSGPVTLPDGSALTGEDFVQRLLVDPYVSLDQEQQTALQQIVTVAVFSQLLSGGASPIDWLSALIEPAQDGRIAVWSAHEAENAVVADTVLGGPAARHRTDPDAFAVYVNDTGGGKMSPYLDVAVAPSVLQCRSDGLEEVVVSVALTSTATADVAALPASVTGGGAFGIAPGDIGVQVSVAAPEGFLGAGATEAGARLLPKEAVDQGFSTTLVPAVIPPGETVTLDFRFTATSAGSASPTIIHTPLVRSATVADAVVGTCG